MAADRAVGRDVHLFDSKDQTTPFGGLLLNRGITNNNLYMMVEILLFSQTLFVLQNEAGSVVSRNENQLQPGNYYVVGGFHSPILIVIGF